MNPRIAIRLWLALALFGADALVWAFAVHTGATPPHVAAAQTHKAPLPAVELPTITVRPDADTLAAYAGDDNSPETALDFKSASLGAVDMPALPRVHLSMPYYSFGKLLPHVRKD